MRRAFVTAMLAVFGDAAERGDVSVAEMVAIGKREGIPVFVDAAAVQAALDTIMRGRKGNPRSTISAIVSGSEATQGAAYSSMK